jgi:hypothetical protein
VVGIPLNDLPQTVQDAIKVCRRVGISYLWVDALCIVQNDRNDKAIEIGKMPYVYGNATLTIVAASSRSVHDGFLQERLLNVEGEMTSFLYRFSDDDKRGIIKLVRLKSPPEPIDERGWTLQERLLSKRIVEFGTVQTRWICQEFQGENLHFPWVTSDVDLLKPLHLSQGEYEYVLSKWTSVVNIYTSRNLIHTSDRPLAISGIAESFARMVDDQYVAGLWKSSLPSRLLWRVQKGSELPRPTTYQGPSWSWTSVNGTVKLQNAYSTRKNMPEILDISFDLKNKFATYGAIREGCGRLKLRARIAKGILAKATRTSDLDEDKDIVRFTGHNDSGPNCIGEVEMFRDTREPKTTHDGDQTSSTAHVVVLEIWNSCNKRAKGFSKWWTCHGLVLRPESPGSSVYYRIGMFERWALVEATRRMSWKEQENYVDTNYNWLKNIEPEVVEII